MFTWTSNSSIWAIISRIFLKREILDKMKKRGLFRLAKIIIRICPFYFDKLHQWAKKRIKIKIDFFYFGKIKKRKVGSICKDETQKHVTLFNPSGLLDDVVMIFPWFCMRSDRFKKNFIIMKDETF